MKALCLILFLALSGGPACAADCYTDCIDASGCGSLGFNRDQTAYCSGIQARCSSDCLHVNEAPRRAERSYGAIAYSKKNGAYGYSYGWKDKNKAEKVALKNCSENGKGCKSVVSFYDSCGAVASDGRNVAVAHHTVRQIAIRQALDKCNRSWFKGKCESVASACSGT